MYALTPYNHQDSQSYIISNEMDISTNSLSDSHPHILQPSWKKSNKLEKADILDMTVKFIKKSSDHLQSRNCHHSSVQTHQNEKLRMFLCGYLACETTFKHIIQKCLQTQQKNNKSSLSIIPSLSCSLSVITEEVAHTRQSLISQMFGTKFSSSQCSFDVSMTNRISTDNLSNSLNPLPNNSSQQKMFHHHYEQRQNSMNLSVVSNNSANPLANEISQNIFSEKISITNGNSLWRPW
ncbi:unnamed protein product [Heterobilharzia americana]|nr:unnamed protein product [Heterobilharzia americana]